MKISLNVPFMGGHSQECLCSLNHPPTTVDWRTVLMDGRSILSDPTLEVFPSEIILMMIRVYGSGALDLGTVRVEKT